MGRGNSFIGDVQQQYTKVLVAARIAALVDHLVPDATAIVVPAAASAAVAPDVPISVEAAVPAPHQEEWRIAIVGDKFNFSRFINGKADESYRTAGQAEASVWAASIIQGFQPPQQLHDADRPAEVFSK